MSDGIKYAIAHEITRGVRLSQAIQHLGLTWEEASSLCRLICDENKNANVYAAAIRLKLGGGKVPTAEVLGGLTPITEGLTRGEVGRGRAFLRSKGLDVVAASLGFWQGTAADFHVIPIDEGCKKFAAVRRQASAGVEADEEAERARRRVLNTSGRELQLLLDPPPHTVNPSRLARGVPPPRAERVGAVQAPPSRGLHPINYAVAGTTGRVYSALDQSDWPGWEALHDAGRVAAPVAAVFTAHSVLPADLSLLDEEELADLHAQQPDGMLGSVRVDSDALEDVGEHPTLPSEEPWIETWFTPEGVMM